MTEPKNPSAHQSLQRLNQQTQPADEQAVFNNWSVIPEAWYFAFRSDELVKRSVKGLQIQSQKIVLFRDEQNQVHAVDSFCPHMGMDLSLGKVVGKNLRCFFHHWEYGGNGRCQRIPILEEKNQGQVPAAGIDVGLKAYPVCEKYGVIWVYAGNSPEVPVLEVPDLEGQEVFHHIGSINHNSSHHHISMINGLDPQHLRTVHGLSIDMDLEVQEGSSQMEFILSGPVPEKTFVDRAMKWLFGDRYSFSMKYSQASIASLTLLRNVYFQKREWIWPRLHMIYAYRPVREGLCQTLPIYLTKRRSGIIGGLINRLMIRLTMAAYLFLKDEDDKVYDHIRFDTRRLLTVDEPIKKYVRFVNRLKPSKWSAPKKEKSQWQGPSVAIEFTADQ